MDLRLLRYFVTTADEGHVGRAAARLHMSQPPLSRAIRQLEDEFGLELLRRTRSGVELTESGAVVYTEARSLLEHAERVRTRARSLAGAAGITVGTLADTVEHVGAELVTAFRHRHPHATVTLHEADLTDPTAGLRAGLADVALTRTPFDTTGLTVRSLRTEPVGVVVPVNDPLAERSSVAVADLTDRPWVRLPSSADERWRAYWTAGRAESGPVARTIQECVQSVLWNGSLALAPLGQPLPETLTVVPVTDREPHRLVVAWPGDRATPLVRSFVAVAIESYRGSTQD
ncbi:MAG TPA: LysR substrate-binding domain-containing protein [Pseudonocardiaceae bacterium]|nr:LysR substrate-binding domain-containing protein [Pseudonocardiaceae bacterium]